MLDIVFTLNLNDVLFIILLLLLAGLLGFIKLADWQEKRRKNKDKDKHNDGE